MTRKESVFSIVKQRTEREQKYLEIITELNKKWRWGEDQIFDCGSLGFVHIYQRRGTWEGDWFEPSKEFY